MLLRPQTIVIFLLPFSSLAAPLPGLKTVAGAAVAAKALGTKTVSRQYTQAVNVPVDQVMKVISDFPTLAKLNPLVKDVKSNGGGKFTITDTVPILGSIAATIDYTVDTTSSKNGLNSIVHAPMGVELKDNWSVAAGAKSGTSVVTESVDVSASRVVMLTVTSNLDSSHKDLLLKLAKLAEKK